MLEKKDSNPIQKIMKKTQDTQPVHEEDKDILSKAISDISEESLVKGLIYSEIFGLPKCKRRGR